MNATGAIDQRITVRWDFPVVFTNALFDPENWLLRETLERMHETRRHRAIVFLDENVARSTPALSGQIERYFAVHSSAIELAAAPQTVPGGESLKNDFGYVERFMTLLLEHRMDRQSFVIIVGGGAVLDAVGLAAALVHRGLRQVRVPTTVLAQNDAGVGVKNGVNFRGGKNAVGTFAPPFAVLNDYDFLLTLGDRDWLCGVAEAFKVSIIRDRAFFAWLIENASCFPARDFAAMQYLVRCCAEMHLDHIATNGDPFEFGRARPLDFGHWSAHKLELMSGFQISHGEAVASGVLLDSIYAHLQNWISAGELEAIRRGLRKSGFRGWFAEFDQRDASGQRIIFQGLREFQEHLGGELTVTFPKPLGSRHEVHEIDLAKMESAIQELMNLAAVQ